MKHEEFNQLLEAYTFGSISASDQQRLVEAALESPERSQDFAHAQELRDQLTDLTFRRELLDILGEPSRLTWWQRLSQAHVLVPLGSSAVAVVVIAMLVMRDASFDLPEILISRESTAVSPQPPVAVPDTPTSGGAPGPSPSQITKKLSNTNPQTQASPSPRPLPAPPAQEPAPVVTENVTPQASRRAADDARVMMNRAKTAARQAGSAATSSSYTAALAAEREGQRLYQSGHVAEAAAKFHEANGLFRSAELTPPPAATAPPTTQHAPPVQRPETQPPPATPPSSAPATQSSAPAPRTTQPPIAAAEGAASPGAEEAIRDLVRRYEQALESRNVDALKRVWPTLQGSQEEAERKRFLHARRIDVDISVENITVTGSSGTVTIIRRYRMAVEGATLQNMSRITMSVRRAGDEWVIDRLHLEPSR